MNESGQTPYERWMARDLGTDDIDVYGIVIEPDASTSQLQQPVTLDDAHRLISSALDTARVRHGALAPEHAVYMWVAVNGSEERLPVNPVATCLYGTGWPILGSVVVFDDHDRPLPSDLVADLLPDHERDVGVHGQSDPHIAERDVEANPGDALHALAQPEPGRQERALEWDDRLDDLDRSDSYELDEDLELDIDA